MVLGDSVSYAGRYMPLLQRSILGILDLVLETT